MPDADSPRDILAQVMQDGRKVLVPHLAEMLKRKGIQEIDSAEERRRFWQRALTPEQEAFNSMIALVEDCEPCWSAGVSGLP